MDNATAMGLLLLFAAPIAGLFNLLFIIVLVICVVKQIAALIGVGYYVPLGYDLSRLLGVTFKLALIFTFIVAGIVFRMIQLDGGWINYF